MRLLQVGARLLARTLQLESLRTSFPGWSPVRLPAGRCFPRVQPFQSDRQSGFLYTFASPLRLYSYPQNNSVPSDTLFMKLVTLSSRAKPFSFARERKS